MELNLPEKIDSTLEIFLSKDETKSYSIKTDKLIANIKQYKDFLKESGRCPIVGSSDRKEARIAIKMANIKNKVNKGQIPEKYIPEILEITHRKTRDNKLDEYIAFVREHNRIPTRKNKGEEKYLNFRIAEQNKFKKMSDAEKDEMNPVTLEKMCAVINHRSLINLNLRKNKEIFYECELSET